MPLLKRYDSKKIVEAIQEAEKNTSGEIRVHIQNRAGKDIIAAAEKKIRGAGNDSDRTQKRCSYFCSY
jgi:uncharacterized membrane protein